MERRQRLVLHASAAALIALALAFAVVLSGGRGLTRTLAGASGEEMNSYILEQVSTYPLDKSYGALSPREAAKSPGVSKDLYYQGKLVMKGDPQKRTHCVGLTFEVFLTAWNACVEKHGGSVAVGDGSMQDFKRFQKLFYNAADNDAGSRDALVAYRLGREVTKLEEARPGDLLQFWRRSGSGHSAVFFEWTRNAAGQISGVRYWGSQFSEGGVGYRVEEIGTGPHMIDPQRLYVTRPTAP